MYEADFSMGEKNVLDWTFDQKQNLKEFLIECEE